MQNLIEAFKNIYQHKFFSLISFISVTLIFVIINLILSLNLFTINFIEQTSDTFEQQIYLKDLNSEEIENLSNFLNQNKSIDYSIKNPKEGLDQLNKNYPNLEVFLSKYKIDNPIPYSINLKTKTQEEFNKIREEIKTKLSNKFDENLNNQSQLTLSPILNNIEKFKKISTNVIIVTSTTLIIISSLILTISIQNNFYSRKQEIQIMELLGAKYSRIQVPIILESIIIVFTGCLLSLGICYKIIQNFGINTIMDKMLKIGSIELITALIISGLISYLISKRQLKKQQLVHAL